MAKDVAKVLGYANTIKAINDHCKGVTKRDLPSSGGVQSTSIIPERDIYRLMFHLKRPQQGKSWSEGRVPTLSDLRGSGALEQLSDVVLAFSRDQTSEEDQDKIEAHVLKNRWERRTGKAADLKYEMDTGRVVSFDPDQEAFNDDEAPF